MKVPVLIPRIFDHPHTYLSKKFGKLKTGSIVSVPFGKEEEIGVVWDKEENTNKNFKLKDKVGNSNPSKPTGISPISIGGDSNLSKLTFRGLF